MEKPLKCRLHIISPVHIGCDDVYEPTSFRIDEIKKQLIVFDPLDFIKSLSTQDRQQFSNYCSLGNISSIVSIYNFISNRQVRGRGIDISDDLVKHYNKVKKLPNDENRIKQELNKFVISRTAYNPHNNIPYITGSSLKGSIRTAYLTSQAKAKGIKGRKENAKGLEVELLGGSFDKDPLRMVKVSDFLPVGEVTTKVVYAINQKKTGEAGRGAYHILEVVKEWNVFEGMINIGRPEQNSEIKKPIVEKELLESINEFFTDRIKEYPVIERIIKDKYGDRLKNIVFLLRLGRHSGAEAVTIEENRWVKISPPGKPFKFSDKGATTLWLASETNKPTSNNGLSHFGWAVLELLPFDVKNIYPMSSITTKPAMSEKVENHPTSELKTVHQTQMPQPTLWENASLTWNPGNMTLTATKDNKKAELKLGGSKDKVPEALRNRLFEKRRTVTTNVTVEPVGNNLRIVEIK